MGNYNAYQIAFNKASFENINQNFANVYYNDVTTPFFENKVMVDLVTEGEHRLNNYFAVLSHKFFQETVNKELCPIQQEEIEMALGDSDVLSFFGFKRDNFEMFRHAIQVHKGIEQCYLELFKLLNLPFKPLLKMRFVVYRNAFFARSEVYERYVNEMLRPCIELMSDRRNDKLWQSIWKDSGYPYTENRFRKHPQLRDKFVHDMGVPYYPFHTFILERMFSYWLNINPDITCKHI